MEGAELDLGPVPRAEADHLDTLLEDRERTNAGRIPLGIAYLDDCLSGVFPGDLLLWGAATGVGKTALAVSAALAGVRAGLSPVHLFALEAEQGEVAARLYFQELGKLAKEPRLDFAGWWRGDWRDLDKRHREQINATLRPLLASLHVLYKGRGDFTVKSLSQQLEGIATQTKMVVLDHIHVVDEEGRESEVQAQKRTVRLLRDLALEYRVPVCVASHVRKQQAADRGGLLPDTSDLHGSSNISKVATQVVVFARDWESPTPERHLAPTLVRVAKDRRGRASGQVARIYYDTSQGRYESAYELGRVGWSKESRKQEWGPVPIDQVPAWAVREARVQLAREALPL